MPHACYLLWGSKGCMQSRSRWLGSLRWPAARPTSLLHSRLQACGLPLSTPQVQLLVSQAG